MVFIISVATFATLQVSSDEPFYVGVTYCGDSVAETKQLIDKVKNYTNLFVLQSGSLLNNDKAIEAIGDYVVAAGLKLIIYYGDSYRANNLTHFGQERWNSSFLGLYYKDEPGGKMIDKGYLQLGAVSRYSNGLVQISMPFNDSSCRCITFYPDATIQVSDSTTVRTNTSDSVISIISENGNQSDEQIVIEYSALASVTNYFSNGTIVADDKIVTRQTNIPYSSYQEVSALNPLANNSETAATFTSSILNGIELGEKQSSTNQTAPKLFTSDYALYWFDYKGGYDTVFAEFVGNESRERHIALCRGAAETLDKDWGVIVTWKYNQAPYLESGAELYSDLSLAYTSGAKYAIVFSYPNLTAYGTLTEEHFEALQKFWTTLHSDPESLGSTPSKIVYVVPADYGFGFRSATDTIWGQFQPDAQAAKIYNDVVTLTSRYGANLNILYEGPETAATLDSYAMVYYYNQTIT